VFSPRKSRQNIVCFVFEECGQDEGLSNAPCRDQVYRSQQESRFASYQRCVPTGLVLVIHLTLPLSLLYRSTWLLCLIVVSDCDHLFDRGEPDWGFTGYMKLSELRSPEEGFVQEDGSLVIDIEVVVTPHKPDDELDIDEEETILIVCPSPSFLFRVLS